MKIFLAGSCQVEAISECMRVLCPAADIHALRLTGEWRNKEAHWDADLVFGHGGIFAKGIEEHRGSISGQVVFFPNVVFSGFHPDMVRISAVQSHTRYLHSALAYFAFLKGLTVDATVSLFNDEVFAALGYFDAWSASESQLRAEGRRLGWPVDELLARWIASGAFMHTFNHPHIRVLADVAHELLNRSGISPGMLPSLENMGDDLPRDRLETRSIWSVYPGIAEARGLVGRYSFMGPTRASRAGEAIGLREFVERSFSAYAQADHARIVVMGRDRARYEEVIDEFSPAAGRQFASDSVGYARAPGTHPYQDLRDYQFWRRSVSAQTMSEVDPVVRSPFRIDRGWKIATAGSCFAQHIAQALQRNGYSYFVTEPGAADLGPEEAHRHNYGVYSARYGNLYTARQLVQLFDRAFGKFVPLDAAWERPDGQFADPFRPQIEPAGFASVDELLAERERHFAAVRRLFAEMDVFIFTLGLTEAWQSIRDGAVFPLAPGVTAGQMDESKVRFVNFTAREVASDISAFLERLEAVNPGVRLILTVSPVPLVATYEDRHVLVSTTYSKSALRVAAEEVCAAHASATYFPSYEIVCGHYNRGAYFMDDLRSVKPEGVDHVMRLFFKHYAGDGESPIADVSRDADFDVVCEEENLAG